MKTNFNLNIIYPTYKLTRQICLLDVPETSILKMIKSDLVTDRHPFGNRWTLSV